MDLFCMSFVLQLAESYPIRRAARLGAYMFLRGKQLRMYFCYSCYSRAMLYVILLWAFSVYVCQSIGHTSIVLK